MIRTLFTLVFLALFVWFGATVNLGRRTLFGHISNIWSSDEAQEMREDVSEQAEPMLERAKRGAKAGWEAMQSGDGDGGAGVAGQADAGVAK